MVEVLYGRIPWSFSQREWYAAYPHGGEEMSLYLTYKHNLTCVLSLLLALKCDLW